jgi:hypothetical protein
MRKIHGMSIRDWKILGKLMNMNQPEVEKNYQTVAEYISNHPESVTNRRTSKKGVELIEITYPTGKVTEYPVKHIDTTIAFEY